MTKKHTSSLPGKLSALLRHRLLLFRIIAGSTPLLSIFTAIALAGYIFLPTSPFSLIPHESKVVFVSGSSIHSRQMLQSQLVLPQMPADYSALMEQLADSKPIVARWDDTFAIFLPKHAAPSIIEYIPESLHAAEMHGYTVISNKPYALPAMGINHKASFIDALRQARSESGFLYVRTSEIASALQISPRLWNRLEKTAPAVLITMEPQNTTLSILVRTRFPGPIPPAKGTYVTHAYHPASPVHITKASTAWMRDILVSAYDTFSIPEQIEALQAVRNARNFFGGANVLEYAGMNLLEDPWQFHYDPDGRKWALMVQNTESAGRKIFDLLHAASRFLETRQKHFVLPDNTPGTERIAGEAANIRHEERESVTLNILDTGSSGILPAWASLENGEIVASSPESILEIMEAASHLTEQRVPAILRADLSLAQFPDNLLFSLMPALASYGQLEITARFDRNMMLISAIAK